MTRERVYRGKDDLIYCREEAEPISLPRRDAITGCDWGNINLLRKLLFFFLLVEMTIEICTEGKKKSDYIFINVWLLTDTST